VLARQQADLSIDNSGLIENLDEIAVQQEAAAAANQAQSDIPVVADEAPEGDIPVLEDQAQADDVPVVGAGVDAGDTEE